MDRRWHIIASLVALMAVVLGMGAGRAAESSGGTTVYRWTDNKGVVHYGDSVPSEFTQSERSVLNSQGVEVGHMAGGKNAAQQAEQSRAASADQQRAQHDQFLLATYLSTKDIEQLRDERLAQMEGQIKATLVYIDTLGARLAALQDRAMHFKPYNTEPGARRLPDELAEDLVRTMSESRTQTQALDTKRHEELDTRAQFDSDIQRYHDLTTRPHS
ncbi:MAG TPA: DUF4124 domain-containing protein [Steroidobacteraceae bacterium]